MVFLKPIAVAAIGLVFLSIPVSAQNKKYLWVNRYASENSICQRIPLPEGFRRIPAEPGSFSHWLRHLPLKNSNSPVLLFNQKPKGNQSVHEAVVDIDIGNRDLQQCADAIIRLRAEYLFSSVKIQDIHFQFTSGHTAKFHKWAEGFRPLVRDNRVRWKKSSPANPSYENFRNYLETVFLYAGTHSLARELKPVRNAADLRIGDVFIQPGFPGHAVLVVDMAVHSKTGEKIFILAQSFMPAQDIHVLKNPENPGLSPWYEIGSGDKLKTPEWDFRWSDLKRF